MYVCSSSSLAHPGVHPLPQAQTPISVEASLRASFGSAHTDPHLWSISSRRRPVSPFLDPMMAPRPLLGRLVRSRNGQSKSNARCVQGVRNLASGLRTPCNSLSHAWDASSARLLGTSTQTLAYLRDQSCTGFRLAGIRQQLGCKWPTRQPCATYLALARKRHVTTFRGMRLLAHIDAWGVHRLFRGHTDTGG